jgi:hypothetical protein
MPGRTGAFRSVATLVRYTGLSGRAVRTCLDRLEAAGIISPCDQEIVAARLKRADRGPKGWDLDLGLASRRWSTSSRPGRGRGGRVPGRWRRS